MTVKLNYTIEIKSNMVWLMLNGGHSVGMPLNNIPNNSEASKKEIGSIIGRWYIEIIKPYGGVLK